MTILKQLGNQWIFDSETELEDFIWHNLKNIFGFYPLKRQHYVSEQYCDILAFNDDQQLIIIELKNAEDRYVVQQLTRYYDAIIQEKPYQDQVDYNKEIRLIALTPSFHRDNLTDRKYHTLKVEFIKFNILIENNQFILQLQDIDNQQIWRLDIDFQYQQLDFKLPPIPKKLLNWISNFEKDKKEKILEIREKILRFDHRIQEIVENTSIFYGKSKTRPCAEFKVNSNKQYFSLFLWLPNPKRECISRMIIYTQDWLILNNFMCVSRDYRLKDEQSMFEQYLKNHGLFKHDFKNLRQSSTLKHGWRDFDYRGNWYNPTKMIQSFNKHWNGSYYLWNKNSYAAKQYQKILENPDQCHYLNLFIEIALEKLLEKLT